MSVPGFGAEVTLDGRSLSHYSHVWSGPGCGDQVIPALPKGGYECVALGQACRAGSKQACQALGKCNLGGGEGSQCSVTPGACVAQSCFVGPDYSVTCYCVATGPPTVQCCYAGACTTF